MYSRVDLLSLSLSLVAREYVVSEGRVSPSLMALVLFFLLSPLSLSFARAPAMPSSQCHNGAIGGKRKASKQARQPAACIALPAPVHRTKILEPSLRRLN